MGERQGGDAMTANQDIRAYRPTPPGRAITRPAVPSRICATCGRSLNKVARQRCAVRCGAWTHRGYCGEAHTGTHGTVFFEAARTGALRR